MTSAEEIVQRADALDQRRREQIERQQGIIDRLQEHLNGAHRILAENELFHACCEDQAAKIAGHLDPAADVVENPSTPVVSKRPVDGT